jgi:hypothetical protein
VNKLAIQRVHLGPFGAVAALNPVAAPPHAHAHALRKTGARARPKRGARSRAPAKREARMMDSRRWQSPAAAAAAAEAAEEDTGGAGGPSRRPARRGMHRASPYGGGPRRWLPRLPVASRIFPAMPRDGAPAGDSPRCPRCPAPP